SRRQFALASTGMLVGPGARKVRAADDRWSPADGVRIAGPTQGIDSLDPALARDLDTIFLTRQLARGLVGYDDDLLPVPELAATIDVADDGLEYTVRIRDDARFQDGRPVEAED